MKTIERRLNRSAVLAVCLATSLLGCNRSEVYPSRPITIVCPWAAGGGTDRVSRQLAMLLEQELNTPVSVINATGGKGVTGHNRGLTAKPDGHTLTMMTFELNTMHWIGLTDLTHRDSVPLVSVNEDYAALFVRNDAPWQSLTELESEIRRSPKKLTASGTTIGGAWHLALAGWLLDAGVNADDIVWVPSNGANPSLQQLISGGVDVVCCSLPEARTLLEADQVRALGVMSPERALGFEEIPTFREQGRDWTLGGWRGLAVPKETPPEIVQTLVEVLERIVSRPVETGSFAEFMQSQKFDNTWRGPDEFVAFLDDSDAKLGTLLTSEAMNSVSQDRFSPMAYPYFLMALAGLSLVGIAISSSRKVADAETAGSNTGWGFSRSGTANFVCVLLSAVAYVLLAETVGFLIVAGAIVGLLLLKLGTRPLPSLLIVLLFVPCVYFSFATILRVPLPRGWLG